MNMKYVLILCHLFFLLNAFGQTDSVMRAELTIVQGTDSIRINDETHQLTLKAEAFKFVFHAYNTDAVFLSCSSDSTSYLQVMMNQKDSLTCFYPSHTYAEYERNQFHDITIENYSDGGYHCLFAYAEDKQFVRLDSVYINNPNDWVGVRTVESVTLSPRIGITELSELKGKYIYFVFSAGEIKNGHALRIYFE